jgi:hypothetical protein
MMTAARNVALGALVPVLLALVSHCARDQAQASSFYSMTCAAADGDIQIKRCENTEVVCYQYGGGFSCIKKASP